MFGEDHEIVVLPSSAVVLLENITLYFFGHTLYLFAT